jgi:hypothetical protein
MTPLIHVVSNPIHKEQTKRERKVLLDMLFPSEREQFCCYRFTSKFPDWSQKGKVDCFLPKEGPPKWRRDLQKWTAVPFLTWPLDDFLLLS